MLKVIRRVLLGSLLGISFWGATASNATAQGRTTEYWPGYWRWYDHTYRPYYHRYYGPTYYETAPPAYYSPPPYSNNAYYTPYYTAPTPYYGNGVQVGPLRFGWW